MSRELLKRCKDFMDWIDLPRPEKLYAALEAELSKPKPEPVAWIEVSHPMDGPYDCHYMVILPKGKHHVYTAPPDQSARIAELEAELDQAYKTVDENWVSHQQLAALQAKREPLSDADIERCYEEIMNYQSLRPQDARNVFKFARAIETAHGIGEII